jgi:hypothetical protein
VKKTILPTLLVCAALAGCVSVKAVDGMMPVDVGDEISVSPQIAWAAAGGLLTGGSSALWTVDGFGLNEMRFMTGIAAGDPLMRLANVDRKDMIAYSTTMLPDDVMEMVSGTLGKAGLRQVQTSALRPVPFGGATGFRFDLTYTTPDGLQMKGAALFAQRRNKLDVILYTAPAEYYFDRYMPTVEKVFASVRVPAAAAMRAMN